VNIVTISKFIAEVTVTMVEQDGDLIHISYSTYSAKRGIATLLSVRPSVCLSVRNVDVPWVYRLD